MPVYRLTPISETMTHSRWKATDLREVVFVRADSEEDARMEVELATVATAGGPSGTGQSSPWRDPDFVSCVVDEPGVEVPEGAILTASGRVIP